MMLTFSSSIDQTIEDAGAEIRSHPWQYLKRKLRDRRFDDLVKSGRMTDDQISAICDAYRSRIERYSQDVRVRTELVMAHMKAHGTL
jgi:DnaJ-domain-containing protein 1